MTTIFGTFPELNQTRMNWEQVYRAYAPGILQYLQGLCGNGPQAEDLLQETFIKAMRSEASLREPAKMRSWLMTIARNQFFDDRRKWVNRNISVMDCETNETLKSIPDERQSPDKFAQGRDFKKALKNALGELSETLRTAFTLAVMQKLSYTEIGEITGWSPAMVKTNVFRARKKVAAELAEFR